MLIAVDDFLFLTKAIIIVSNSKKPPSEILFCLIRLSFQTNVINKLKQTAFYKQKSALCDFKNDTETPKYLQGGL